MKFKHDFIVDLDTLIHEAEHGEPFAFVRFNDGERAILQNTPIPTADGWRVGDPVMRRMMGDALNYKSPAYYKGITCQCCDPEGAEYYHRVLAEDARRLTFANLFVNGNAERAFEWIEGLATNWCVVSSYWGSDVRVPARWDAIRDLEHYVFGEVVRLIEQNRPILIAAGPLGKLLLHRYWTRVNDYGRHTIIDIGSVLDPVFRGKSRNYHNPDHPNRKKICRWT